MYCVLRNFNPRHRRIVPRVKVACQTKPAQSQQYLISGPQRRRYHTHPRITSRHVTSRTYAEPDFTDQEESNLPKSSPHSATHPYGWRHRIAVFGHQNKRSCIHPSCGSEGICSYYHIGSHGRTQSQSICKVRLEYVVSFPCTIYHNRQHSLLKLAGRE